MNQNVDENIKDIIKLDILIILDIIFILDHNLPISLTEDLHDLMK